LLCSKYSIRTDPQLRRQWTRINAAFNVQAYRDHKGVIRRTMGAERNLRPSFSVNPRHRDDVFRAAFNAFCLRWNLYGMQSDEPLLLKLAVNIRSHLINGILPVVLRWRSSFCPKLGGFHHPEHPKNQADIFMRQLLVCKHFQAVFKAGMAWGVTSD
jgi:hypothetical protein